MKTHHVSSVFMFVVFGFLYLANAYNVTNGPTSTPALNIVAGVGCLVILIWELLEFVNMEMQCNNK